MSIHSLLIAACVVAVVGCEGESVEGDKQPSDTGSQDVVPSDSASGDVAIDTSTTPDTATTDASTDTSTTGRGPAQVELKTSKGTFSIDQTEVSNAQYKEFSDAKDKPAMPAFCAWKTGYAVENPLPAAKDLPVVNVDWCDAYQYCAWAGKRLCGGMGGGHVVRTGTTIGEFVADSQWTLACQNNAMTAYSTGNTYPGGDAGVCNITNNAGMLWGVTSGTACKGAVPPFDTVINMTGNAAEWEDNCTNFDSTGADKVVCFTRGGSASPGPVNDFDYKCATADIIEPRNKTSPRIGFRCCSK